MSTDPAHALRVEVARLTKERDEARLALANAITARDEEMNESDARADAAESALAAANARADAAEALAEDRRKARDIILGDVHELRESLAAARRECEGLRKLLSDADDSLATWHDDAPADDCDDCAILRPAIRAALAAPASAPGKETS